MADDLIPIGEVIASSKALNGLGQKPVTAGRKKKPRYTSKAKAREVLEVFVDLNSHKLQQWLEEIYQERGAAGAFTAFIQLVDYAVPKLQRREITGADEGPVELKVSWMADGD